MASAPWGALPQVLETQASSAVLLASFSRQLLALASSSRQLLALASSSRQLLALASFSRQLLIPVFSVQRRPILFSSVLPAVSSALPIFSFRRQPALASSVQRQPILFSSIPLAISSRRQLALVSSALPAFSSRRQLVLAFSFPVLFGLSLFGLRACGTSSTHWAQRDKESKGQNQIQIQRGASGVAFAAVVEGDSKAKAWAIVAEVGFVA